MKVIKIGATWCNGCLVMRPRWKEIEEQNPWLITEYFDFDQDKDQIKDFGIESGKLPVFIFVDNLGNELLRLNGEVEVQKLLDVINDFKDK